MLACGATGQGTLPQMMTSKKTKSDSTAATRYQVEKVEAVQARVSARENHVSLAAASSDQRQAQPKARLAACRLPAGYGPARMGAWMILTAYLRPSLPG